MGARDLRPLWSPPFSLNPVHVLVFFRNFYLYYLLFIIFYFMPSLVFIRIEQRNLWKEIREFRKKENRANQPRFVFFIRDEQFCASIRVKGVLLQLWSEPLTNRIRYGLDRTLLAKRPMRKVRQCPTECPRPGGMIPTVRSWLHLIVTVGLEKMGRLCKRVCLSLPALAHRCPSSRPSVRRQSWPCRFNSLGIWVVGLDPHPTPGPFCDGPELRHRRSEFIYKICSIPHCLSFHEYFCYNCHKFPWLSIVKCVEQLVFWPLSSKQWMCSQHFKNLTSHSFKCQLVMI